MQACVSTIWHRTRGDAIAASVLSNWQSTEKSDLLAKALSATENWRHMPRLAAHRKYRKLRVRCEGFTRLNGAGER
jgi:hypothetical protein